ncbi:carbohydrate sulfotransferase 8-like [Eublepharis macularius]|uniref:Carbohydrate sulfotransferase n=1 Tax=Eublepharis macularius TaxID=481883 RepID=A0AA97IZ34_EUBMA|nr:carbohydrate sulfotransferase 8-like [Eublepharis macularius]XP_054828253.1 carbohydrate sulfotransferase 8-like [Eublepharis macularius]XP_054828254.1 carbohydrate sulfotransferase 8-like [Eublepharis macularius]XP_054828255.1 carbohydrate sulfotransferase 8-like [Eublepharis macularius]
MKKLLQKLLAFLFIGSLLGIFLLQKFRPWQPEKKDPEKEWLKRQNDRKDQLYVICQNENLSSSEWKLKDRVARQLFVVQRLRLIYCEVPKVGCSNWKRILLLLTLNLDRDPSEIDQNEIHRTGFLKRLSSYPSEQQMELLDNYTKVMFTRHPLERLVSAYRDKLLHNEPYYGIILTNEIKALLRKNINSTKEVTFQEFVQYVVTRKPKDLDIHWKPMFALCDPCNIHYDILGKYETLAQDAKQVLKRIGAPESLHYPNTKMYSSEKRTNKNITWEYLRELSWNHIGKLKEIYRMDFSLFNYSFNFRNETLPLRFNHTK